MSSLGACVCLLAASFARITVLLTASLFGFFQAALAAEPVVDDSRPTVTFVCEASSEKAIYQISKNYLTTIFDQLGHRYIQKHTNTGDALELLRDRKVDGDCARLDGFLELSEIDSYVPIGPAYTQIVFSRWFIHQPSASRKELRVGYNANGLVLKHHLMKMGYEKLFPIDSLEDSIQRLRQGEWDLIVNYGRAMSFLDESNDYTDIQKSDSFVTLPVRPYVTKPLAEKLRSRWTVAAKAYFQEDVSDATVLVVPKRSRDKIVFSCSVDSGSSVFEMFRNLYSRLFEQLGYDYQQVFMPRARETHELSLGHVDGSCARTKMHAANLPNAIRVDAIIGSTKIRVWSLNATDEIRSLEDLRPDFRIAYVRDTTLIARNLKDYRGQLVPITTMLTGIKMLAAGRVDYLIGLDNVYQASLEETTFQSSIYAVGSIGMIEAYPYFHRSRSGLAERLEALLRDESKR